MNYILHIFYAPEELDGHPINFKEEFSSIYGLTGHLEDFTFKEGSYTFVVEVKQE